MEGGREGEEVVKYMHHVCVYTHMVAHTKKHTHIRIYVHTHIHTPTSVLVPGQWLLLANIACFSSPSMIT